MTTHVSAAEPWRVTVVDTGEGTMTGGRIKRVRDYIGDETFCLTYGDCVADLDISTRGRVPSQARERSRPWPRSSRRAASASLHLQ